MLVGALMLFILAALGGATMAGMRLQGRPRPPTWLALGHGGIALTGLLVLIYAALVGPMPTTGLIALGVFVLAALGGGAIFALYHLNQRELPLPLVFGHGAVAALGIVLLTAAVFFSR
jgi:hypothetical protein